MAKNVPSVSSPLNWLKWNHWRRVPGSDTFGKVQSGCLFGQSEYGKCPKILNAKPSDKMAYANSVDPDQTAPEGAVWSGSTLFAVPPSILRKSCIKSKI